MNRMGCKTIYTIHIHFNNNADEYTMHPFLRVFLMFHLLLSTIFSVCSYFLSWCLPVFFFPKKTRCDILHTNIKIHWILIDSQTVISSNENEFVDGNTIAIAFELTFAWGCKNFSDRHINEQTLRPYQTKRDEKKCTNYGVYNICVCVCIHFFLYIVFVMPFIQMYFTTCN